MISLAFAWALLLLPLPLLVWLFVPPYRVTVPSLRFPFFRRIVDAAGAQAGPGSIVQSRTRLQMVVSIIVWVLLVLALARPEKVGAPVEMTRAARDVILAIDISGSMDAKDFATPDGTRLQRLAGVRQVVDGFIKQREGDRMALIVFGTKAYLQSPLTEDLGTLSRLLNQTDVAMAGPHTALGDAIGLAIRTFEASDIKQRLLILLSDGSDTVSRMSPVNAAEIAKGENIEIYTIGVGDPEATGEDKVDLASLKEIASRTGGAYFFAEDQDGLQKVYSRINELAPRISETLSYRPRQALAFIPLALAALVGSMTIVWLAFSSRLRGARA